MFNSKENELVHTSLMAEEAFKTASALRELMYEYATSDNDKEWLRQRLENTYVGECTVEIIENWLKDRGLYGVSDIETFNAVLNHVKSTGNHYYQTRVGSMDGVLFNNDKSFKDWLVSCALLKKSDLDKIDIVVDDDGDLIVYLQILNARTNEYLPAFMPAVSVDGDILNGFLFHGHKEPKVTPNTVPDEVSDGNLKDSFDRRLEVDKSFVTTMNRVVTDPILVKPDSVIGDISFPNVEINLYGEIFHADTMNKSSLISVIKSISNGPWMLGVLDGRLCASQSYYRKLTSKAVCDVCEAVTDAVPKIMSYEVNPIKGERFTHPETLLSACSVCGMDNAISREELERVRAFGNTN